MRKEKAFPGCIVHVFNRGVDRRPLFLDERDREWFIACLYLANSKERVVSPGRADERNLGFWLAVPRGEALVEIGAFCLMGNHFHLVLRELEVGGISRFMHDVATSYSRYFNVKYRRSGRLFQGPYRLKIVDASDYLAWLVTYVHANPRDLLEKQPPLPATPEVLAVKLGEYRWSSLGVFTGQSSEFGVIMDGRFSKILASCAVSLLGFIQNRLSLQAKLVDEAYRLSLL